MQPCPNGEEPRDLHATFQPSGSGGGLQLLGVLFGSARWSFGCVGLFLPHERGARWDPPFSRHIGCPNFPMRFADRCVNTGNFFRPLPTNTTEVNQCTIFELIMVDISQHSLIEISYVYVILCFRIPTSCRYKKNHNHFKDHHFWEHRAHPSPTTPSVQGGADPTSLRQGLDLAKCASTRKICRGWRCWRPVGGLGWCQFCWGGWWGLVGYATWNWWSSCCFEVMEELSQEKRWCFSKSSGFLLGCPRGCIFFLSFSVLYVRCFFYMQYWEDRKPPMRQLQPKVVQGQINQK